MAERIFTEADIERIRALNSDLFTDTRPRSTTARLPSDLAARLPLQATTTAVPARVYATDTPAHVDRDSTSIPFDAAHIVYLTPSPGELFIGDEVHSLDTPGQLFTIPAGTPHGTRGTDHSTRISIGPFNEAGRPVGGPGFTYYDANRIDFLQFDPYTIDTPYTVRSFSDVGGTLPSGQRFLGWTRFSEGTEVGYAVSDTALLTEGLQNILFYPVLVTPPSSTQQITRPSNAVLSAANAMVNASAETASVAGIALVQARRSNPAMRFPDHASYIRYQQGIARAQIRRAANTPQVTGTPVSAPSSPTITEYEIEGFGYNDGLIRIDYDLPTNTGGAPILFYTLRAYTSVSGPDILYNIQNSDNVEIPLITISPLSVDVPYTFRLTVTNAVGESELSAPLGPITIPGRPSSPQDLTATPGNGQVVVTFTAPSYTSLPGIDHYVLRTFLADTDEPVLPDLSGNVLTFTKTGLTNDTNYYFRVYAVNNDGFDGTPATSEIVTPVSLMRSIFTEGSGTWTVPEGVTSVEYLVVGGGGGGGGAAGTGSGGGGGGGSLKTGILSVSPGDILSYTVGDGGAGGAGGNSPTNGSSGTPSLFATVTANGGGNGFESRFSNGSGLCRGGAGQNGDTAAVGGSGGGTRNNDAGGGLTPTTGAGAGGGGGAGGDGADGFDATPGDATSAIGGNGGSGISSDITGTVVIYGNGGKGGNEGFGNIQGTAGTVNTGTGGGGAQATSMGGPGAGGGAGGSGIIVLKYNL